MIQKPQAVDYQTLRDDLRDHFRGILDGILTEPLPLSKLARYFDIGRNKVRLIIESIDGVEKVGRRYRVPLKKMPPAYFLKHGLIPRD